MDTARQRGNGMAMEIDACGLACPGPVLRAKDAVDKERPRVLRVAVDNGAAAQNVSRFLGSQGYAVEAVQDGAVFRVTGTRPGGAAEAPSDTGGESSCAECQVMAFPEKAQKILVVCATDRIGHGDDVLGQKLMANFLKTLKEMGADLWRLIFLNGGVKLACEGSEALPVLEELEKSGISILVCGACLDFFKLLEQKRVGETTNMLDVVTSMQVATSVVNV